MNSIKSFIVKHKTFVIGLLIIVLAAAGISLAVFGGRDEAPASAPGEEKADAAADEGADPKSEEAEEAEKTEAAEENEETAQTGADADEDQYKSSAEAGQSTSASRPSAGNTGSAEKPSAGQNSGTSCQHNWVTTTRTEKEPHTVIVTEKVVQYDYYRFYWYNTRQWEETRDPDRFDEWQHDRNGGPLSPNSINMAKTPEDRPLFKGYDSNGHATYTNDHVHSTLSETVPCEPYEKTEYTTVTITTIVCSKCGATR